MFEHENLRGKATGRLPGCGGTLEGDAAELRDIEHGVAFVAVVAQRAREPLRAARRLPDGHLRSIDGREMRTLSEMEDMGEKKVLSNIGKRRAGAPGQVCYDFVRHS